MELDCTQANSLIYGEEVWLSKADCWVEDLNYLNYCHREVNERTDRLAKNVTSCSLNIDWVLRLS